MNFYLKIKVANKYQCNRDDHYYEDHPIDYLILPFND